MDVGASILYLVVVVVLSLIFREVVCWYWKINEYLAEFRMLATSSSSSKSLLVCSTVCGAGG
jgi:Na+/H+-dicarboxylate symporter